MRKLALGMVMVAAVVAGWALAAYPSGAAPVEESAPTTLAAAHAAASVQEFEYLGPRDGCRKCHLREYRSWEDTPHATAIELLEGEDATNPECLRCHTTGFGEPTGFVSMEETPALANVTCEVCHGPGSEYMDRETMKDREASIAAGLLIPNEQTCLGCHNSDSPTFPGEFDFESMREKGVHEIRR